MLIRPMSDLHLEFKQAHFDLLSGQQDVLIFAGDIGLKAKGGEWALAQARRLETPAIYVIGNHEFYKGSDSRGDMKSVRADLHDLAETSDGMLAVLDNSSVIIKGVRFLGATLWTDFAVFGDPARAMQTARHELTDYRCIFTGPGYTRALPSDFLVEHHRSREFLLQAAAEPFKGPTVVVTHHAPHRGSIAGRYAQDWLSPAYASDLTEEIETMRPALWIHGHMHLSFRYSVGRTLVLCNPRGYHGLHLLPEGKRWANENPDFDPDLVVEI